MNQHGAISRPRQQAHTPAQSANHKTQFTHPIIVYPAHHPIDMSAHRAVIPLNILSRQNHPWITPANYFDVNHFRCGRRGRGFLVCIVYPSAGRTAVQNKNKTRQFTPVLWCVPWRKVATSRGRYVLRTEQLRKFRRRGHKRAVNEAIQLSYTTHVPEAGG